MSSVKQLDCIDSLLKKNIITNEQVNIAKKIENSSRAQGYQKMLSAILVDLGFVTESDIEETMLHSIDGDDGINLNNMIPDPVLVGSFPKDLALSNMALPLIQKGDAIQVAILDVYDIVKLDKLRQHFPKGVRLNPVYASEPDLIEAIDRCYGYEMSISKILEELENWKDVASDDSFSNPTVRLVNSILIDAVKNHASDIHFEPEKIFVRVRYRVDGRLIQICSFSKEFWNSILVRIKILSGMNITESRKPQDGSIAYNISGNDVDFRAATQPTIHGENVVLRILNKKNSLVKLEDLGMTKDQEILVKKILQKPSGITIVTGPTGSGKTTSLYSILNHINSMEVNIMTMENPVEYKLPIIRQSNVNIESGVTFSSGMRSLMRQDPDIIFVGEVRDSEAADLAFSAAMTGHQVFTTLHTNDSVSVINRLVDLGVNPNILSGALSGIITQRLMRKLCTNCRQEYVPDENECQILGISEPCKLYKAQGCDKCLNTGYKGRKAIFEVIYVDQGLDNLIAEKPTRREIMTYLTSAGFVELADSGILDVLSGVTDLMELSRIVDLTGRMQGV